MKYQESFPPGSVLCTAEGSCMELKKEMILIINKEPFYSSLISLFINYD